jgi:hypothetical protein
VQSDLRFGIANLHGAGVAGKLNLSQGMRMEFDSGKPVAVVAVVELKGEASAEWTNLAQKYGLGGMPDQTANRYEQQLGFDPRSLADKQGTLSQEGSLKIEVRTPIDASPVNGGPLDQLRAFKEDPTQFVTGGPQMSVTARTSGEANDRGFQLEVAAKNFDPSNLNTVLQRARSGDFEGALAATGTELSTQFNTYRDRGFDHDLDVKVASIGGKNYVRDVDNELGFKIGPDSDGTGLEIEARWRDSRVRAPV